MTKNKEKEQYDKPVSLYPLKAEKALAAFMKVKPEKINKKIKQDAQKTEIEINVQARHLDDVISELNFYIPKIPLEIRKRLFGLFNFPAKLVSFKNGSTSVRTGITILLEPSNLLLNLLAACRTGNFEELIIK